MEGPTSCVIPIENSESKRDDIKFLIPKSESVFDNAPSMESAENKSLNLSPQDQIQNVYFTTPNYIVDHTKSLSFEPAKRNLSSADLATPTFLIKETHITLQPDATRPFIVTKDCEGEKERKSLPFTIDEVSICEGGMLSSPIIWKNKSIRPNYYAYRKLKDWNKSEVHVIPE